MRSNGLTAAAYRPIADIDPIEADILLDELRERLIAAYCQPIESGTLSGFDRGDRHNRLFVRLFVDAAAIDSAASLVSARDPHLLDGNDDLAWAQIVAGFDVASSQPVAPWPILEDVDEDAPDDATADEQVATLANDPEWRAPTSGVDAGYPTPVRRAPDDPTDRFVPPDPPPFPRLAMADQLGWLGVIGGPLVLLADVIFTYRIPSWVTLFAVLGFIAGFVVLVMRLDRTEDRDDTDDGAQV